MGRCLSTYVPNMGVKLVMKLTEVTSNFFKLRRNIHCCVKPQLGPISVPSVQSYYCEQSFVHTIQRIKS